MRRVVLPTPTSPKDVPATVLQGGTKRARWFLALVQLLFLISATVQIDSPFLSMHNERQNQTFDVARHVFHEGWSAVLAPKASFSLPGYEQQPFTCIQLEFPFHGLLGWPLAAVAGHERAAVRTVSILFALASIQLVYAILGRWVKPAIAAAGAALWASSPLVVQLGEVPMPDILCTTGMLAAFFFALRGNLPASSGWFLFSILAKPSVIVFGLPILTVLLVEKGARSLQSFVRVSFLWGIWPLLGLAGWILVMRWFSPPTPWTVLLVSKNTPASPVFSLHLWLYVAGCLVPYGAGVLGVLGIMAGWGKTSGMDHRLRWAILASNAFYFLLVLRKIHEAQYFLPPLFWILLMAAPGLEFLAARLRTGLLWRAGLATAIALHILVALVFGSDLKASRVPDFAGIQKARECLPPGVRVIAVYRFYGASAAVWLERNVYALGDLPTLTAGLGTLKAAGFTHLCLLEIESRHNLGSKPFHSAVNQWRRLLGRSPGLGVTDESSKAMSDVRRYCDDQFAKLFESPHVVVYSLSPTTPRVN